MSHPLVGHDYTEKSSDETNKEYKKRAKAGMSVKSKIAGKMKGSNLEKLSKKPEYKKANKKFDMKGYKEMMK